jgi:hypothetical protein
MTRGLTYALCERVLAELITLCAYVSNLTDKKQF